LDADVNKLRRKLEKEPYKFFEKKVEELKEIQPIPDPIVPLPRIDGNNGLDKFN